eukprot:TRINITY_DN20630_c0_g1_i1.p2 TRINITY_DN20630_c0_g1~~TRINITY_DN20630_c0_g1_i1.p2  ORF type:complete len:108 (+),score=17.63 TRINITY_DN20630_c0_g1_i1:383-706(+)
MEENFVERLNHCINDTLTECLYDLPYIPVFAVAILISPWRICFWTKEALGIPESLSYKDYLKLQPLKRGNLLECFVQGLLDLFTVLWMILSVLYFWRIPFFVKVALC